MTDIKTFYRWFYIEKCGYGSMEEKQELANEKFDVCKFKEEFERTSTPEQLKFFGDNFDINNPNLNNIYTILLLYEGFQEGLTLEQAKYLICDCLFKNNVIQKLVHAFVNGLTISDVKYILRVANSDTVYVILYIVSEYKLSEDEIEILLDPYLESDQILSIYNALCSGLSFDKIKEYIIPENNARKMEGIFDFLKLNPTDEQFEVLFNPEINEDVARAILHVFKVGYNITCDQIKSFASNEYCYDQILAIAHCYDCGLSEEQISVIKNPRFDKITMYTICDLFEYGFSINCIKKIARPKYIDDELFDIIEDMLISGIPVTRILKYVRRGLDSDQLELVKRGFLLGLKDKEIEIYAKNNVDPDIMELAIKAIKRGLSLDKVTNIINYNGDIIPQEICYRYIRNLEVK